MCLCIWNSAGCMGICMYGYTVKPPNNRHIGTTNFVRYTERSVARRVQRSRAYFNELARTVISLLVML